MSEQRFREMADKILNDNLRVWHVSFAVAIAKALAKVESETRAESAGEIERLKKHIADEVTCYHGSCLDTRLLKAQLKTIEAETVERCAEVADDMLLADKTNYTSIGKSIRSLIK